MVATSAVYHESLTLHPLFCKSFYNTHFWSFFHLTKLFLKCCALSFTLLWLFLCYDYSCSFSLSSDNLPAERQDHVSRDTNQGPTRDYSACGPGCCVCNMATNLHVSKTEQSYKFNGHSRWWVYKSVGELAAIEWIAIEWVTWFVDS